MTDRASPMLPSATANLTSTSPGLNFELTGYETAQNPQVHVNSFKFVFNQSEIGRPMIGMGKYGILFAKHIHKSTRYKKFRRKKSWAKILGSLYYLKILLFQMISKASLNSSVCSIHTKYFKLLHYTTCWSG
nr:hypothetical protein Iba_chr06eCG11220 [Ipomoea batatas]